MKLTGLISLILLGIGCSSHHDSNSGVNWSYKFYLDEFNRLADEVQNCNLEASKYIFKNDNTYYVIESKCETIQLNHDMIGLYLDSIHSNVDKETLSEIQDFRDHHHGYYSLDETRYADKRD